MNNMIKKEDILSYGYYDEAKNYVVVIDRQKLKEIFDADRVIFEESYRTEIEDKNEEK